MKRGIRTIVGLHAYEGGTGLTLREDAAALAGTPVDGVCLFREGAFVMAFAEGRTLRILNTLNKPVTGIIAGRDGKPFMPAGSIRPGEETGFSLTDAPELVRAFCGDEEVPVWLTKV